MLDPSDIDPLVDVKTFQYILKLWITNIIPHPEDSKSQLCDSFSSKLDMQQGILHRYLKYNTDHCSMF